MNQPASHWQPLTIIVTYFTNISNAVQKTLLDCIRWHKKTRSLNFLFNAHETKMIERSLECCLFWGFFYKDYSVLKFLFLLHYKKLLWRSFTWSCFWRETFWRIPKVPQHRSTSGPVFRYEDFTLPFDLLLEEIAPLNLTRIGSPKSESNPFLEHKKGFM